jgi:Tol biopolymer transport system component
VRLFDGPGSKKQISADGGTEPVWSPNGRELFYRNGNKMMVVNVSINPQFSASKPELLFSGWYATDRIAANYDISPDGQRFLMIKGEQTASTQIKIILNWAK